MSISGEGVGWASGEHRGSPGSIESEEIGLAGHVRGVGAAEDRKIADQTDVAGASMRSETCPLLIEEELNERVVARISAGVIFRTFLGPLDGEA